MTERANRMQHINEILGMKPKETDLPPTLTSAQVAAIRRILVAVRDDLGGSLYDDPDVEVCAMRAINYLASAIRELKGNG